MKVSKLSLAALASLVTVLMAVLILSACNSGQSNKETEPATAPTTTTDAPVQPTDPTTTGTATNNNTTTNTGTSGKKIGKVSMSPVPVAKDVKMEMDKQGYYNYAETAPTYPGGQSSLENYISNNIEYPQDAIDNEAEGTVNVKFAIDQHGKVSNATVVGGNKLGYGLEEEAVKVISEMPKWTPGQVKGKNVKTWYTLPITYKLEG